MSNGIQLELTGQQYEPLSKALRATLKQDQFDRMLKQRLNLNREDITLSGSYEGMVFEVIDQANREGWVMDLLGAARQERPRVALFVDYASKLGVGPAVEDVTGHGIGPTTTGQLEKVIEAANLLLDIDVFRSRLGEIEGQVCRVDLNSSGWGTGFLVGPDLVLTNYHVMQDATNGQHPLSDYTCRFDFKVRPGGQTEQGTIVDIKELVKFSPYDPADLKETGAVPDPANLDFALLRLAEDVGKKPIGGVPVTPGADPADFQRGWVTMPQQAPNFPVDSPLFIAQHPNKKPMKLALDTKAIILVNSNNTRVRYRTNTEPGSSGSPCFNQQLQLAALHHSGDTNWTPIWNEGIPINLVQAQIQEFLPA